MTLFVELTSAWDADDRSGKPAWAVSEMEAILDSAGLPSDLLARAFLDEKAVELLRGGHYYGIIAKPIVGWAYYLAKHRPAVRESLAVTDAGRTTTAV